MVASSRNGKLRHEPAPIMGHELLVAFLELPSSYPHKPTSVRSDIKVNL